MNVSDITARETLIAPLAHLRALVDPSLDWNYTLDASSNVITYSFDISAGMIDGAGAVAFNSVQQQAARLAMAKASAVTGITFVEGSAATADWHFAAKDLPGTTAGLAASSYSWSSQGDTIVSLDYKTSIFLDNRESADTNNAPSPGTYGFETLLHEVGHALGLKHPFEGTYTLPSSEDNTDNTLMSYTETSTIHSDYSPYDVAALRYIYGGDGLGGLGLGPSSTGTVIDGTAGNDAYTGGDTVDIVSALWGNDLLSGGGGADQLYGNQGADTVYGNGDADTLFGGQGDDLVFGGSGDDALYGNMMSDVVYGGEGVDRMFGGQGDDRLFGDAGDDLMGGNLGNDTLTGGAGADVFLFGTNSGDDVITDFDGASGDRLLMAGITYSVGTASDGSALLTLSGGGTVTLAGVAPSALNTAWIS